MIAKEGVVYCLHDVKNGICRIGQTTCKNNSRINQQLAYYPFELTVYTFEAHNTNDAENAMHRAFNDRKVKADWFSIDPKEFIALSCIYQGEYTVRYKEFTEREKKNQDYMASYSSGMSERVRSAKRVRIIATDNGWKHEMIPLPQ